MKYCRRSNFQEPGTKNQSTTWMLKVANPGGPRCKWRGLSVQGQESRWTHVYVVRTHAGQKIQWYSIWFESHKDSLIVSHCGRRVDINGEGEEYSWTKTLCTSLGSHCTVLWKLSNLFYLHKMHCVNIMHQDTSKYRRRKLPRQNQESKAPHELCWRLRTWRTML